MTFATASHNVGHQKSWEAPKMRSWPLVAAAGVVVLAILGIPSAAARPVAFDTQVAAHDGAGEPEVAVDAKDANVLVDAYTQGIARSADGGRHWVPVVTQTGGDPVVVADHAGHFFATLDLYGSVLESTDQGRHWKPVGSPLHSPPPVGPSIQDISVHPADGPLYMGPSVIGCDRPLMGADATTGSLYATCSDHGDQSGGEGAPTWPLYFAACRTNIFSSGITTNCGRRYISASHDHGQTWTAWEPEDGAGWPAGYTGAFDGIPVATHGVLATGYVAGSAPGSDCAQCVVFETSTNDSRTWSRHLVPGATPEIASLSPQTPPGAAYVQDVTGGNDNQTMWFEPYVAADPARAGRFAIMVLDATRTELLVYETVDSGAHWSGPTVLGDRVHRVDKPAMAFGPTGALGLMWKSVHQSDLSFDVWSAVSPGMDLPFGAPARLSSRRSAEETCGLGGSEGQAYACDELSWMTMDATHLDATWGDNRNGENPWFGRYDFAADPQFHHP